MSVRALWIISVQAELPLYSRYFPSVEARARSALGNLFVKIPPEKEIVKILLLEVGLREKEIFIETRDRCDKQVLYPAFQLRTENGILWPVTIIECKGLILCTLSLDDNNNGKCLSLDDQVSLSHMPCIALALEVLNGLADCILNSKHLESQGNPFMTEVVHHLNVSLPFGRPLSSDVSVCKMVESVAKGKAKVPTWNPVPHKGKSQVVLHIREEVQCMQFNHLDIKDAVDVFGTVTCRADVEGNAPEMSVVLIYSTDGNGLVVNPGVCNVENIGQVSSRLRFYPSNSQPLCHYSVPLISDPPIYGAFTLKITDNVANVTLQLQLKSNVKNLFQQLEVYIPFPSFIIQSVRPNYSQGSVKINSKNIVAWKIGSKFPSKTLTATLSAVVKLNRIQKLTSNTTTSESAICPDTRSTTFSDNCLRNMNSAYSLVLFRIADYTYSSTKIDPQSIVVSTAAKVRCSVSSEFISKVYKLWNSEGEVPISANVHAEELANILNQT